MSYQHSDFFNSDTNQNIGTTAGAKLYGWNLHNPDRANGIDVGISNPGELTITQKTNTYSNVVGTIFTVPFLYKNITGDFDVETKISDLTPQNHPWSYSGIIVRDVNISALNNSIALMWGISGSPRIKNRNTTDSLTTTTNYTNLFAHRYLRMVRSGNNFNLYSKAAAADAWGLIETIIRPDFVNATIQVGLFNMQHNSGNYTFTTQFEYFKLSDSKVLKNSTATFSNYQVSLKSNSVNYSVASNLLFKSLKHSYDIYQGAFKSISGQYSNLQQTTVTSKSFFGVYGALSKTFNDFYHLLPPVPELYTSSGQKIESLNIGLLTTGLLSTEVELIIWNNKTGGLVHLDMSEVFIGVSLTDGSYLGGSNEEGQEVVSKKFVELKSNGVSGGGIDDAQTSFTAVGGKPPINALAVGSILSGTGRHIFLRFNLPATVATELSAWPTLFISYKPVSNSIGFGFNFGFNHGA